MCHSPLALSPCQELEWPGWLSLQVPSHHPQGTRTCPSAHPHLEPAGLTLREAWWVVVDISDHDGDCGGSREAPQLSCHVCSTDHHLIAVLSLAVQVCHGRPDHTCKPAGQLSTGSSQSHRQGEAGRGHWRSLWTRSRPKQIQLDLPLQRGDGEDAPVFHQPSWPCPGLTLVCPQSRIWCQIQHLHLTSAQQKGLSPPLTAGDTLPSHSPGAAGTHCWPQTISAEPLCKRPHEQKPTKGRGHWGEQAQGVVSQLETSQNSS